MPLEIREIVLQMQVDDDNPPRSAATAPERSAIDLLACCEEKDGKADTALVEQCVRAVLAELDRRRAH